MKKLFFYTALLATLIVAGVPQTTSVMAQDDCTTTIDCSTNGKSIIYWCVDGSGNCLCGIIITCPVIE